MKKKIGKEAVSPTILSVGDQVVTPISNRLGKIVKITEEPIIYGSMYFTIDNLPCTMKEYTVDLLLPCLKIDSFKKITMVCIESELTKNQSTHE